MVDALNILFDDRAFVERGGHVVGGGTDDLDAALVGLVVGPGALEAGQEGVVDVDGAAFEGPAEVVGQHLHVARQHHQLGAAALDDLQLLRFGLRLGVGGDGDVVEGNAVVFGQRAEVGVVGDDGADLDRQHAGAGAREQYYEIDPKNSWIVAAAERNLPIVCPGWEDSTTGNIFASNVIKGKLKASTVKSGIEYMVYLTEWYRANSGGKGVGFFQIGGGIAGDFPICVVPMMYQDLEWTDVPFWAYFCQISDSTTSYGSYSGAVPNEKITWGKLDINTPKFIVESDAIIVAPLIFAYILGQ